jgi:hypothetical protein
VPRPRRYTGRETLADRIVAGLLSGLAMAATLFVVTAVELFNFGFSFDALPLAHLWGMVLVGAAAVAGVVMGPRRMAVAFGYLWGTEDRERQWITAALWAAIVAFIALVAWLG